MKQYLLLLRTNLRAYLNYFRGAGIRKDNGRLDISRIALYITALIGLAVLGGMVVFMETMLYRAVAGLGFERILIGLALLLSMVTTLLFGVFHTLGALYFNRETAQMAHLPISERTLLAARWTEIYLGEMLFSFALLLPMLINHGVATGAGVGFYAAGAAVLLTTPLYPLSIALVLASLLGRVSSFTRHKEVWVVVGTIAMVALVVGLEMKLLPSIPEDADALFFINLITNNEALLEFLIGAFPPVLWAVRAISGGWGMLALYVAVGLAAMLLTVWLAGGSYMRVCLRHTEQGMRRRSAVRGRREEYTPRSPFRAVFFRELNEVFKTPVYLMNAVMGVMMMPIMLMGMSVGVSTSEEGVTMRMLVDEVTKRLSPLDLTLIIAALFSIMCLMCPLAATAVSREGKRLPIMRMIPVSPRTILWAKLLVSVAIIGAGSAVMAVAAVCFLGTGFVPHVLAALVLANVLSLAVAIGNITVDVLRPVLEWKNETEVMKQNMNSLFGALVSMVMLALAVAPPALMFRLPAWSRMAAAAGVVFGELALALLVMRRVAEPRFAVLEP